MYFLSNSSKPIDEADVDGTSEATCLGAIIFRLVVEGFLGCGGSGLVVKCVVPMRQPNA